MSAPPSAVPAARPDGRRLRSERTRVLIMEAYIDLLREHMDAQFIEQRRQAAADRAALEAQLADSLARSRSGEPRPEQQDNRRRAANGRFEADDPTPGKIVDEPAVRDPIEEYRDRRSQVHNPQRDMREHRRS